MADIGTERLLLAALRPLTREGGLLAALPANKGAFHTHLCQAGARTDAMTSRPSPNPRYSASPQYTAGNTMAQRQLDRSPRQPAGPNANQQSPEETTSTAVPAQPQSAQTPEAPQQTGQTSAGQDSEPQQTADPPAADEKEQSSDEMQPSTVCEPCADGQQTQAGDHQLGGPDQAFRAERMAGAAAMLKLTSPASKAPAKPLQPEQPSGDASIADADGKALFVENTPAELAPAESSVTQPPAHEDAGTADQAPSTPMGQVAAAVAASTLEPMATAALAADKSQPARQSQRNKDSAYGETRATGGIDKSPAEQTGADASAQPAPAQVVQSAVSGDFVAAQRTGETASGKSDTALSLLRQNSGTQQATIAGQSGKEQSPAPAGGNADASAGEKAEGLSTLDRVRFVQRVARAFEAIGARAGAVRLRLSPPELGMLRVEIAVRDGALSAHLQAENYVVRNLLLDNLPALRERLAQQDIRIDRFQVDVFEQPQTGNWQQPAGQSDWQQPGRYRTLLGEQAAPTVVKPPTSPSGQRQMSSESQLDVLI